MGRASLKSGMSPKERLYRLERPSNGKRPLSGTSLLDQIVAEDEVRYWDYYLDRHSNRLGSLGRRAHLTLACADMANYPPPTCR